MEYNYKTKGVCSRNIHFNIENDVIQSVHFEGGCEGSLVGISQLVTGMNAKDAAQRLKGIGCGRKGTSCPDQLSKALTVLVNNSK